MISDVIGNVFDGLVYNYIEAIILGTFVKNTLEYVK